MTRKDPTAQQGAANPSTQRIPDPADSYGREKPQKQAGQGRLDNDAETATPTDAPDRSDHAVRNRQKPDQEMDLDTNE